ncbi:GLY-1 protein, partial [Aphelenchoides avenae]
MSAVVSRETIDFMVQERKVLALLKFLKAFGVPDEKLWATVAGNPSEIKVPGGFDASLLWEKIAADQVKQQSNAVAKVPSTPEEPFALQKYWIGRYQIWGPDDGKCKGIMVRNSCVFGVGDLPDLLMSPQMVAHKFYLDYQPAAFFCLYERIRLRALDPAQRLFKGTVYSQLPQCGKGVLCDADASFCIDPPPVCPTSPRVASDFCQCGEAECGPAQICKADRSECVDPPPDCPTSGPATRTCQCANAQCRKGETCTAARSTCSATPAPAQLPPCPVFGEATGKCKCSASSTCSKGEQCDYQTETCGGSVPTCPVSDPAGSECQCGTFGKCKKGEVCNAASSTCTASVPAVQLPRCPVFGAATERCKCSESSTCAKGEMCDYRTEKCNQTLPKCPTTGAATSECQCGSYNKCKNEETCDAATSKCTVELPPIQLPLCPVIGAVDERCTCGATTCTKGQACDYRTGTCGKPLPECPFVEVATRECQCGLQRCNSGQMCIDQSCQAPRDLDPYCSRYANLCNNPVYKAAMNSRCAATCARTSSSLVTNSCVDNNTKCAAWFNMGFCDNTYYTTAQKKAYCAKTCGFCRQAASLSAVVCTDQKT